MNAPDSSHASRFRDWITRRLGLRFEDSQLGFLSGVLAQRATRRALPSMSYVDELEHSLTDGELHALISELTVPETYFFRHLEQYRAYGEIALPRAQRAHGTQRRLKVASVGCASGEEPYSLAMWARDHGAWPVDVFAVDLNPAMLAKARRGLYSAWALRETPPAVQQQWFRAVSEGFELDPDILGAVQFERINLAEEHGEFWTAARFDVIFCRNVLMYFTPDIARAAVARMTQALTPGGYFFMGHAETMRGLSDDYELCHSHNAFYYQRRPSSTALSPGPLQFPAVTASAWMPEAPAIAAHGWPEAIRQSADRIHALSESGGRPGGAPDSGTQERSPRVELQMQSALELLKKERFGDALTLLDGLPADHARLNETLLLRGALLMHSGRLNAAEEVSEQLLMREESNAGAHYLLALCREHAGDLQGARVHDAAAIRVDAAFAMPRLHLGLMARKSGEWEVARQLLDEALPLLEREAAARVLLFGGGFGRDGLIALCRAELRATGARA